MADRRSFIAGLLAAGLLPTPTWAEVGHPTFLSAGMKPDGAYVLCGLTAEGEITFELPLPARGHAAAAHPFRAEAVAFARRPGTYAIVLDCVTGAEIARLEAPEGRHFYGHGAFSTDGDLLFTTENEFDAGQGRVGIWDARNGYARIEEFSSGGVGPHDIKLIPGTDILAIANGGIETHPDTGRTKLNLPTMQSNLSYLSFDGEVLNQVTLGPEHQRNSIRHLAVAENGTLAFAMQWQGDLTEDLPLLGIHHRTSGRLDLVPDASVRRMNGYLGSIAMTKDGRYIATTSPRAGLLQQFEGFTLHRETSMPDACGVATARAGFIVTTGTGHTTLADGENRRHAVAWDNHLVEI